jgi:hypothetical protein
MVVDTQPKLPFCAHHSWMGSHGYFLFRPATPNPPERNIPTFIKANRTVFPDWPDFLADLHVHPMLHAAQLLQQSQNHDYVLLRLVFRLAIRRPFLQSRHSRGASHYCYWAGTQRAHLPSAVCLQPSRDEQSDRV